MSLDVKKFMFHWTCLESSWISSELVPDLDSVPDNTRFAPSSHFGWLSRIFSPAKPTYSIQEKNKQLKKKNNQIMWRQYVLRTSFQWGLEFYDRAIWLSRIRPITTIEQLHCRERLDPNYREARQRFSLVSV